MKPPEQKPETDTKQTSQVTAGAGWRAHLDRLLSAQVAATAVGQAVTTKTSHDAPDVTEHTQLALQFEVRELLPRTSERWNGPTSRALKAGQELGSGMYRLGTRPALRTQRGWARGNLTWANIGHQGGRLNLDDEQQRWFRQFYALHRAATAITLGQDPNWVFLDDFVSPALWVMLRQAEQLGIELLSSGTHTKVRLHAAATLGIDATTTSEGAGIRLHPRLLLDGEHLPLRDSGAIGDHGIYLASRGNDRTVHLAEAVGGLTRDEITLLNSADAHTQMIVSPGERESFLSEGLPVLRTGFRVESTDGTVQLPASLPEIKQQKRHEKSEHREAQGELKLTITRVPSETEDWFDLGVLVTVGEQTVPFTPLFRALAKGEKKLRLIDHTYLSLSHPALAPLAELIAEGQVLDEWQTGLRVSRHQAIFFENFEDAAEQSEAATRWRALVSELAAEHVATVAVPQGIRATLRPYQLTGFYWLAFLWRNRLGGILADDMGLGKTLQCLTLIEWVKNGGSSQQALTTQPQHQPFLVIAPTSVMSNWAAEAARFAPGLRVRVRTATEVVSDSSVAQDATEADIIVTSYALFRLDYERYREVAADAQRGIAGLILDEAQFVKNTQSIGNQLAEKLPVTWKLAVTGTPMENSLRELHAICKIVAPGLFASARRFEKEYVRPIERPTPGVSVGRGAGSGPQAQGELRASRIEQLRHRLRPFMLRRTKALVATELPEKYEQILEIELDPGHRQLYDTFLQRERQKLFGLLADLDRNRFTVFRSLTLLRMLALDASLIDEQYAELPSAKLDVLALHAAQLVQEGKRTLVFSQFTSFLDRARERLHAAGVRTVTLDGSTRKRDAVIECFRRGEADVFLISLKAGGIGLNLTEADTVFLLDPWWNPASESQAIDRTHRIGQKQPVQVLRMIALGTIEEKVLKLQQRKRALFDAVVDDEALFSHALTAGDVRELLG